MKISALLVAEALHFDGTHGQTALRMAQAQDSEGIRLNEDTWAWIMCFADFDYEYGYLVDVRHSTGGATTSDYLAIFIGYDHDGTRKYRCTWHGHPATFPEVPNLYDAIQWWGQWLRETRVSD